MRDIYHCEKLTHMFAKSEFRLELNIASATNVIYIRMLFFMAIQ